MPYIHFFMVLAAVGLVGTGVWRAWTQRNSILPDAEIRLDSWLARYEWGIFAGILVLGAVLRLYGLASTPAGFNQDEASIAVDAIAVLEHGTDRFGYPYPVYPVAWGAGHAPFLTYATQPFMALFGTEPWAFRLCNALLSVASLAGIYFLFRKTHSRRLGLIAMTVLATAPWNIMLARWSLDSNPLPSLFILATCALVYAWEKKHWLYHLGSGLLFALVLYGYGTAFVVVPLFLLGFAGLLWSAGRLQARTAWPFLAGFGAGSLPMAVFLAINFLKLPEIRTPLFSVPRLTAMRSGSVFRSMEGGWTEFVDAAKAALETVFWQSPDLLWNNLPQFGNTFLFSTPLILLGAVLLLRRVGKNFKENLFDGMFLSMLGASAVLLLLLSPNVNRAGIAFVPVIVLIAMAIDFLLRRVPRAGIVLAVCYAMSLVSFAHFYFTRYDDQIGPAFFESFGDAVRKAVSLTDGPIFITEEDVNGSWVLTEYYAHTPPQEFANTVVFRDNHSEFRSAERFGRFVFASPGSFPASAVGVVHNSDASLFAPDVYDIVAFKFYSVVSPRSLRKASGPSQQDYDLANRKPIDFTQSWGEPRMRLSLDGNPLRIGNRTFPSGIGTHAESRIRFAIPAEACALAFSVGIDQEVGEQGKVRFQVLLDSQTAWQSPELAGGQEAVEGKVRLQGAKVLELRVDSLEDKRYDHADWGSARFMTGDCE